jgi:hypothetical protein
MLTLAELTRDIAFFNPHWQPADIQQRTRLLREARLLPHSGRGRRALRVSPAHAATLLIGVAAADKTVDVVEVTRRYLGLKRVGGSSSDADPVSFADSLAAVLADPAVASRTRRVTICRTWPEARIEWAKEKKGKKRITDRFRSDDPLPPRQDLIRLDAVLDPKLLEEIASHLAGLYEVTWTKGGTGKGKTATDLRGNTATD